MEIKLKALSKEQLQEVIVRMRVSLTEHQRQELKEILSIVVDSAKIGSLSTPGRMSQEFLDEKIQEIRLWMEQIDNGELYLNTKEYEDYSSSYWDRDWITEYYDHQHIGDKIGYIIRFAKDCVDERHYEEAHLLYEWLWKMQVFTGNEYGESVDLETLAEEGIVKTDLKKLALLTLYVVYQVQDVEKRAESIYKYFSMYSFQNICVREIFVVGRENLTEKDRFWKDWIILLENRRGNTEQRLLLEAVLYREGVQGLVKMAEKNCNTHPSLYLAAMKEYEKEHDYAKIEELGIQVVEKMNVQWMVRSEILRMAAYAASCLAHREQMMQFCWETFQSDSNYKNYLLLFGIKEMAEKYGLRGKEVLDRILREESMPDGRSMEPDRNRLSKQELLFLKFFMGDFEDVKRASKNPRGALGWSSQFIPYGICLFLLYLYERPLPSKAAMEIASYVGFLDDKDTSHTMSFERKIIEESDKYKTSVFWTYFQKWKAYFLMEQAKRKKYLAWVEGIIYQRADAIVDGQYRNRYKSVAVLLAMVAEIKVDMGTFDAKREIYSMYKKKFPRHSSFQADMKEFFNMW